MSRQREQRRPGAGEPQGGSDGEGFGQSDIEDGLPTWLPGTVDGRVLNTDEHLNAPAIVVRPDDVQQVLASLKQAGYDHCACVSAQEYADRFETIYHLRCFADPTDELSVVVPTTPESPTSESVASVYPTADWHEREAYDLLGIEYEDHPDLRRILLPETWQGHPLRRDYDQDRPQIVTLSEHANPLAEDRRVPNESAPKRSTAFPASADDGGSDADTGTDTMFLNVGPHHPATHGVLHLEVVLDGEQVVDVEPDVGYIHRCEEQMCQQGTYRHQIMPYPDRWDWSGAGLCNEWAYARVAEDLADVDVPEYAQVIRTMGAEFSRMLGHLLAVGTYALDVVGDFTATFMWAMRERERVQDVLEELTGQRLMFNYFRLGGVAWDLPEPREEFFALTRDVVGDLPRAVEEFHTLLTNNEVMQLRTVDTGILEPDVAKAYGCTGPVVRGSGIDYDLRRDDPYGYYDELEWDVVTEDGCDNYARVLVRLRELEQSAWIVEQCVDLLEDWLAEDREIQSNVPRTLKPDRDAECYRAVESAKGELGIYLRSDGTDTPARFKIRGPSFSNLSALPEMAEGGYLADLVATLGSLDPIMGDVDR